MTTARTIIKRALQKSGIITKNDGMSGDEATDGLFSLNTLLGSWSNENLIVYDNVLEEFPLIAGQAQYTMGSGGDFDTVRPLKIINAYVRQSNIDYNLSIISASDYDLAVRKTDQSIPDVLGVQMSYPLMILTLYDTPYDGLDLFIRSQKPLTEIASLDTEIAFPSGWEKALIDNLALELAPEYGQPVNEVMYEMAIRSKGAIKSTVTRNRPIETFPLTSGNNNNLFSGWYI